MQSLCVRDMLQFIYRILIDFKRQRGTWDSKVLKPAPATGDSSTLGKADPRVASTSPHFKYFNTGFIIFNGTEYCRKLCSFILFFKSWRQRFLHLRWYFGVPGHCADPIKFTSKVPFSSRFEPWLQNLKLSFGVNGGGVVMLLLWHDWSSFFKLTFLQTSAILKK